MTTAQSWDANGSPVEVITNAEDTASTGARLKALADVRNEPEISRTADEPTADFLLQEACEHPDHSERRRHAYLLYQRGLREGVALANAAADAARGAT